MNALTPSCRMPHCMWLHVMCACRRRESYKLKKIGFALIRRVHVSHSDATHSFGSFGHTFRCERHCTGNVISLMWQRMTANSAVILLLHAVAFQMLFYLSPTDTFHFVAFSSFHSTFVTVNSRLYLSLTCTPIDETLLDTCWFRECLARKWNIRVVQVLSSVFEAHSKLQANVFPNVFLSSARHTFRTALYFFIIRCMCSCVGYKTRARIAQPSLPSSGTRVGRRKKNALAIKIHFIAIRCEATPQKHVNIESHLSDLTVLIVRLHVEVLRPTSDATTTAVSINIELGTHTLVTPRTSSASEPFPTAYV